MVASFSFPWTGRSCRPLTALVRHDELELLPLPGPLRGDPQRFQQIVASRAPK
jgi:hypothetical protein